jgi:hypothetical protein
MEDELRPLFIEWIQQQQRACDAQMEANKLVCKIIETLMVRDMLKRIEEMPSGNQRFN